MPKALILTALCAALLPPSAPRASVRQRKPPEDQIKLGRMFFAQDEKCRGLLREERWKDAEAACRESVRLADRFADHRELEKLTAYAGLANAMAGQRRYAEAVGLYKRAIEVSRPRLGDTDAEVGGLYLNIALAHHNMRDPNAAREWYRKAEKTYRAAYSGIDEAEVTAEMSKMKGLYLQVLRRVFEFHLRAAEEAGDEADAAEVKKKLAELP